jgi:hypothetical protein
LARAALPPGWQFSGSEVKRITVGAERVRAACGAIGTFFSRHILLLQRHAEPAFACIAAVQHHIEQIAGEVASHLFRQRKEV